MREQKQKPDKELLEAHKLLLKKRGRMGVDAYSHWINNRATEYRKKYGDLVSNQKYANFIKWAAKHI